MRTKVGLVGIGHLGKIHFSCLRNIPTIELVGFYDEDKVAASQLSRESGIKVFDSLQELISASEAIDIVTPTSTHFEIASVAIKNGRHVFIEKPVTATVDEADKLKLLQQSHGVIIQVGHVERFNPGMLAIQDLPLNPKFIEVHRLANFNPRGTDVSVVLDLMIHDLDIILSMVPSTIKSIHANGVPLVSASPDIGNARIEWENGCVANVTASRLSLKNMRKMRLFQSDAYIAIDFLERSAQIIRLSDGHVDVPDDLSTFQLETASGTKTISIEMPETQSVNAIQMELESFVKSVKNGTEPHVGINAATEALSLAFRISQAIDKNLEAGIS